MNGKDNVLVLLVDHNSADLVPEVLRSIEEDSLDVSILLLANGSSDASYKQLQQLSDPRVRLIRSTENLGFAGGNNYGLKYARENMGDFAYLFLLNTDAYVKPNLIGGLKAILDQEKNAACISPKIFARSGKTWYGGSTIIFEKGKVTTSVPVDESNLKPYYEVDVFNGCAVLFRTERFIEAGMLNEKLFLYYEEADCSMNIKKLGYKILYAPQYHVLHDVSYSSRNFSFVKTYYMTRNKFYLFNDSMTLYSKIYFLMYEAAFHFKNKRYKNVAYLMKGFIDFKRGKTGKLENQH